MESAYKHTLAGMQSGVAVLKIDRNAKLWTRQKKGVGFQVEGNRDATLKRQERRNAGIIVKAKLDKQFVCPRKLDGKKVFYRVKWQRDSAGVYRPYLWLAARSDDTPYRGTRCIVIAASGDVFIAPEKSLAEKLAKEKAEKSDLMHGACGFTESQLISMENC